MLIYRPNIAGSGIHARPSGFSCQPISRPVRFIRAAGAIGLLAALTSCCLFQHPQPPAVPPAPRPAPERVEPPKADLAAFKAVLAGHKAVPPSRHKTGALPVNPPDGELVAVLNRDTGLLRWKLTYAGLSGQVRNVHFTKSAQGRKATLSVLSIAGNIGNPYESSATLTPEQRNDLLAGRWLVSLGTTRFPKGELHGQLLEQP